MNTLVVDLLIGVTLTLTLGAGVVLAQDSVTMVTLLAWIPCILAGLAVVGRRHRPQIVAIGAVFSVLMLVALVVVWFWIQWHRGTVDQ